jgi:hypothetical protein
MYVKLAQRSSIGGREDDPLSYPRWHPLATNVIQYGLGGKERKGKPVRLTDKQRDVLIAYYAANHDAFSRYLAEYQAAYKEGSTEAKIVHDWRPESKGEVSALRLAFQQPISHIAHSYTRAHLRVRLSFSFHASAITHVSSRHNRVFHFV